MITFRATLQKFGSKGEKTGWTFIELPQDMANQLKPNTRTSFRVKGTLDQYAIKQVALVPIGEGDFILAVNGTMRRGIRKEEGATVTVCLEVDDSPLEQSADLLECLEDDPAARAYFNKLPVSHQTYYSKWIESAKTAETRASRIAKAIRGMSMGMDYGEMIRYFKQLNEKH